MYCSECGKQLPEGVTVCPDCSASAAPVQSQPQKVATKKTPGNGAKGYAAIISAFMVFPAMLCVVINLLHGGDFWAGYVLGALACAWVILVLPALRITPPAVTGIICFATLGAYFYYLTKSSDWFMRIFGEKLFYCFIPLGLLLCIFIAVDVALAGTGKVNGYHLCSLGLGECALFFVVMEIVRDIWKRGVVELRWSLVLMCFFISGVAIIEAMSYISTLSKKK